jgi:hypothetical protein
MQRIPTVFACMCYHTCFCLQHLLLSFTRFSLRQDKNPAGKNGWLKKQQSNDTCVI